MRVSLPAEAFESTNYLAASPELRSALREYVAEHFKELVHSRTAAYGSKWRACPLTSLAISHTDAEQVWQQLELANEPFIAAMIKFIRKTEADLPVEDDTGVVEEELNELEEELEEEEDESEDPEESVEGFQGLRESDVDEMEKLEEELEQEGEMEDWDGNERFFNEDAMAQFADEMEENEDDLLELGEENEESEEEDEDSDTELNHRDFFAAPTPFDLRQKRTEAQIAELEEENTSDKHWAMTGEVAATSRPLDSLLETTLDFDMGGKLAEPITEETTATLEDLIRQRCADRAWDDVVRMTRDVDVKHSHVRKEVETDKSELGLGEIYEKEFVDKVTEGEEKATPKEHIEIGHLVAKLFYSLDSLSNYHFTPNPLTAEVQIRSNVKAVTMEEAMPVAESSEAGVAPEEVYSMKGRRQPIAAGEMDTLEKKARRSRVKRKMGLLAGETNKAKKAAGVIDEKELFNHMNVEKGVAAEDLVDYSKSSAVFKKIQGHETASQ